MPSFYYLKGLVCIIIYYFSIDLDTRQSTVKVFYGNKEIKQRPFVFIKLGIIYTKIHSQGSVFVKSQKLKSNEPVQF